MMKPMTQWALVLLMSASCTFGACNKNKQLDAQADAAERAAQVLGENERFAREKLDELTDLINQALDQHDDVPKRVEAFLEQNRNDLVRNARNLEATLAALQDPERAQYEEIFRTYMTPSVERWSQTKDRLRNENRTVARAVDRALKATMNRRTQPTAN